MPKPSSQIPAFREALKWFKSRVPMAADAIKGLFRRADARGFQVAGVAQLRVVDSVFKRIESAIKNGDSFDTFKASVRDSLENEWRGTVAAPSARIETIFRTNIQTAYSAGRQAEMNDPDTLAVRPFWLYSALMDMRTTTLCRSLNGTVLPADHPFWKTHTPPLHFNCRGAIRSLMVDDATARGISPHPPAVRAAEGFGTISDTTTEPDISDVAPELKIVHRAKVAAWKSTQE